MASVKVSRDRGKWKPRTKVVIDLRGAEPVPKGSMKGFIVKTSKGPRAVVSDSKAAELRAHERDVRLIATREMDRLALPCAERQPFEIVAVFYLPRAGGHFGVGGLLDGAPASPWTKPDFDKLTRATCDAITGIVWDDDCRVVRAVIEKRFADAQRDVGLWFKIQVLPATIRELNDQRQLELSTKGPTR